MSKELKIKGALDKDFKQVYIDDKPTNIFITEEGKIKTATIKQTVDGNEVEISGTNLIAPKNLQIKYDNDNKVDLTVASDGHLSIVPTGTDPDLTLDFDGTAIFNSGKSGVSGSFAFQSNGTQRFSIDPGGTMTYNGTSGNFLEGIVFSSSANGVSVIQTNDASGAVAHLTLDVDGDLILDPASGNFIAKKAGTEFSATNSAYAGMILGYTDIGLDEARQTYTLTTSFVVPTDEFSVSFKAPPSGNVEIMISVRFNAGSSGLGDLYAGLSSGNASLGYVQLADFHEEFLIDQSGRNSVQTIQNYWTLTGLTAGTAYEYWVGFKSSSTTGTPMLEYGGSVSGHNPDFIMKATALPATITT